MKPQTRRRYAKCMAVTALSAAMLLARPAFAENGQLELIPDDTAFYFGTGEPVSVEDMVAIVPDFFDSEMIADILPGVEESEVQQKRIQQISDFLKNPTELTERWGLGDELQFSAYAIGLMPVLRVAGDAAKFEAALAALASENDFTFDELTHKDIDVRIVSASDDDEEAPALVAPTTTELDAASAEVASAKSDTDAASDKLALANEQLDTAKSANDASGIANAANQIAEAAKDIAETQKVLVTAEEKLTKLEALKRRAEGSAAGDKDGPGFIIAADGSDIVFAFSHDAYNPDSLDQILGLQKPATSLESSGKVKDLRKEWSYDDQIMSFVDFKLIADALTDGDGTAASQLRGLVNSGELRDLEPLSDVCKAEVRQLADDWPMMVSGYRKFEVTDDSVIADSHFALLMDNQPLREFLQLVRGYVPVSKTDTNALMSLGVGFDVDNLPQISGQLTDLLANVDYQCESLSELNKIGETDISAFSMGAVMVGGMARGIKGLSVNLYDAEINPESSFMPVNSLDAAIALVAEDPAVLLQTMRMLPQTGMLAELPLDGTPMSLNGVLPVPLPPQIELFAAVKGKNIVLYSGSEAKDFADRVSSIGEEGFMLSTFNTAKILEKIGVVADQLPEELTGGEDMDAVFRMMESYPTGNLSYKFDFTDKGIEFEGVSDFERPAR